MQHYIVGLDVGSRYTKAAIGEVRKGGRLALIRVIKFNSSGIRKGIVDDLAEATHAISQVVGDLRRQYKNALRNIFLGIGGGDVKIHSSTGVVAVSRSDSEIYQDDISRAIQGSQAINLPPNRMMLHFIIKEFIVDNVRDIRDPLGMVGNRLEVNGLVIDVFSPVVKNLTKCVETCGGSVGGLVLTPLADARSALTKNQRELGVVVIDIGFGRTGMAVYEENKFLHTALFPFGSANITNDLAIGLKIPVEVAETVKLSFGFAVSKDVSIKDTVDLAKIDPRTKGLIPKKFIAEIIEVRLEEIFELVGAELKKLNKAGRLPAGVVLVGGGAKLPGLVELVKQTLKLPTQIGVPDLSGMDVAGGELSFQAEDPEFATAVGLLLSAADKSSETKSSPVPFQKFLKNIIRHLIP